MEKKESRKEKPELHLKRELPFRVSGIGVAVGVFFWLIGVLGAIYLENRAAEGWAAAFFLLFLLIGLFFLYAIQVARQWEKAVVLRFGRFIGLRGPGLFFILPLVDQVSTWIDHRVMVTPFNAEKTLTRDTVPVDVDAVLFWVVWDA